MTVAVSQTQEGATTTKQPDESDKERVDRELMELLNEVRVALPGVTVLFGFLLTLPFTGSFDELSVTDRNVYFSAVVLAVLSTAFLVTPSAHHRARFRTPEKEAMLKTSSVAALTGIALFAAALAACLYLIADVSFSSGPALAWTIGLGAFVLVLWFVVPLRYRSDPED